MMRQCTRILRRMFVLLNLVECKYNAMNKDSGTRLQI